MFHRTDADDGWAAYDPRPSCDPRKRRASALAPSPRHARRTFAASTSPKANPARGVLLIEKPGRRSDEDVLRHVISCEYRNDLACKAWTAIPIASPSDPGRERTGRDLGRCISTVAGTRKLDRRRPAAPIRISKGRMSPPDTRTRDPAGTHGVPRCQRPACSAARSIQPPTLRWPDWATQSYSCVPLSRVVIVPEVGSGR